jgi:RNA polymerase sigma-70 factor (ECF subfamily)
VQTALVDRARRGDHEAFSVLAGGSVDRLYAVARLILRDTDLAEDATQDALIRAWRDLPALRDPDRFDGWLHRVLVRSCSDQVRRRRRDRHEPLPVEPRGDAQPDGSQRLADRDELATALAHLSLDHRVVVVLHYYMGLSHPEIAAAIDEPLGTVKSRLSRAVDYLRAELAAGGRVASVREGSA